jgi:lysophospholipase L1-like esterase
MNKLRFLLIFFILLFVLLEVTLRVVQMVPSGSATFVSDENIGVRMRANIPLDHGDRTNALGFNDVDHSTDVSKGTSHLAIVGDSFVFGVVKRDLNFAQVLQRKFDEGNRDIRVMNMGIPGIGPKNYLMLLKNDAKKHMADTVYVMFFVGNDLVESHPDFKTKIAFGSIRQVLEKPYTIGMDKEYFSSYRMFRAGLRMIRERYLDPQREDGATFSRAGYLAIEKQRAIVFKTDMSQYTRRSYDHAVALLHELAETAAAQSMDLKVILAPDEIQVDEQLRADVFNNSNLYPSEYDFTQPQKILSEQLDKKGIAYIDLLPAFVDAGKTRKLYKKYDSHWNKEGNKLAAELIYAARFEADRN